MNPENERPEEIEAKITALILGELEPFEVAAIESAIAGDPELGRLRDRLQQTIDLVREATVNEPAGAASSQVAPRLSEPRRSELLRHFQSVLKPAEARGWWRWGIPMAAAAGLTLVLSVVSFSANLLPQRRNAVWEMSAANFGLDSLDESAAINGAVVDTGAVSARAGMEQKQSSPPAQVTSRLMMQRYGRVMSPPSPVSEAGAARVAGRRSAETFAGQPATTASALARRDHDSDVDRIIERNPVGLQPPAPVDSLATTAG